LNSTDPLGLDATIRAITSDEGGGIVHGTYDVTLTDGTHYAIGFFPGGSDGNGGLQNDIPRLADPSVSVTVVETFQVSDAQARDGAMAIRNFEQTNNYDELSDNCGKALDVGLAAAGANSSHNYRAETLFGTVANWATNAWDSFWDAVAKITE